MKRSGAWKTVKLKPYNFKAKGAPTPSGALHPCENESDMTDLDWTDAFCCSEQG